MLTPEPIASSSQAVSAAQASSFHASSRPGAPAWISMYCIVISLTGRSTAAASTRPRFPSPRPLPGGRAARGPKAERAPEPKPQLPHRAAAPSPARTSAARCSAAPSPCSHLYI